MSEMQTLNIDTARQSLRDVKVGKNVKIFNFVNAYECTIHDDSKVGSFVEIQKNATIGKRCKISSHTFICEGVEIKDDVFVGHNVSFINDRYPQATTGGKLQTDSDWVVIPTVVEQGASIGTGSTILCGIKIGRNAIVGAGAVVTKDVQDNAIVGGNPARLFRMRETGAE